MGYTTEFKGELRFKPELKASELAHLNKFLGDDIRDHLDWEKNKWSEELRYSIDLELNEDYSGIEWTGTEKSYEMVAQVNYIISQMRKINPAFELEGSFLAQGEDLEDRWSLTIGDDGWAKKSEIAIIGQKVRCPHCEQSFFLNEES